MTTVEQLRPGGEAALGDLRRMAFGATEPPDPDAPRLTEDRSSCVYDGDRLIAVARTRGFAQWFGGRAVPCGGLSGVMIATDHRGAGLGKAVVSDALERMRDRGEVISSLYPTTASLYRSLGYEIAGTYRRHRIPIDELPRADGSVTWEPTTWDAVDVRATVNRAGADHDGWLVRPELEWQFAEHQRRKDSLTGDVFVGHRDDRAVAVVGTEYGPSDAAIFALTSHCCVGTDPHAMGEALAFLGRHGTTTAEVEVTLPEHLLHAYLDHAQRVTPTWGLPWMTRIVDLAPALAARGWNPAANATVDLEVTDSLLPANEGRWRVEIADGAASVEAGGSGAVRLDMNTLASWYVGHAAPAALARQGRVTADDPDDLARMAAVVSGGEPPSSIVFF